MALRAAAARWLARLEPPPRVVDWSLLAVVLAETATGLVSFTVGDSAGWPLFWLHRALGLAFVALLGWKLARVGGRLTDPDRWLPSTALSALTLVAAVGTVATGVAWVFGLDVRLSYWTLLSVHVGFGLALVPLVAAHAGTRARRPRRADTEGRRDALRYAVLLGAGVLAYRSQKLLNAALDTAGAARRFTGSQPREGAGNASFPVTSWVADDPDPVDRDAYRLAVTGLVADPTDFAVDPAAEGLGGGDGGEDEDGSEGRNGGEARDGGEARNGDGNADDPVVEADAVRALLDCTSGWYTVQRWEGVRVGDLLAAAGGPTGDAAWVRFVSVTGYRWSLPLAEAEDALLATRVGGERLTHGHGAPVRLVAPGRRGFQWVKWVTRVEVRAERDPAQWVVTLVSGFD